MIWYRTLRQMEQVRSGFFQLVLYWPPCLGLTRLLTMANGMALVPHAVVAVVTAAAVAEAVVVVVVAVAVEVVIKMKIPAHCQSILSIQLINFVLL
jgi:hypothetical protein